VQIEKRYPESAVDTLHALSVLGLRRLNGMSEEDAGKLGNDEIVMLSEKYGQGMNHILKHPRLTRRGLC